MGQGVLRVRWGVQVVVLQGGQVVEVVVVVLLRQLPCRLDVPEPLLRHRAPQGQDLEVPMRPVQENEQADAQSRAGCCAACWMLRKQRRLACRWDVAGCLIARASAHAT